MAARSAADAPAKVPPARAPHHFGPGSHYALVVRGFFARHAAVVAAAAVQLVLSLVAPRGYAGLPAAAVVAAYAVSALVHWLAPAPASRAGYAEHVVRGRASAPLPGAGLVVFKLGVQFNHPLGVLCPGGRDIKRHFDALSADLLRRRAQLGLVAVDAWRGADVANATSLVVTYYFRDVDSVHRFAHEDLHRAAWDWYGLRGPAHIGVYHETFVVPPGAFETVYVNCAPVGLGRGTVPRAAADDGGPQWLSTLVSADTPALKTQMSRLHREAQRP